MSYTVNIKMMAHHTLAFNVLTFTLTFNPIVG